MPLQHPPTHTPPITLPITIRWAPPPSRPSRTPTSARTSTRPSPPTSSAPRCSGEATNSKQTKAAFPHERNTRGWTHPLNPRPSVDDAPPTSQTSHFNNDPRLLSLPWADLFYQPGLPPKPKYDTATLAGPSLALADAWYDEGAALPNDDDDPFPHWPTLQRQIFLERLLARAEKEGPMAVPVLEAMDRRYALSATRNSEVRFRWAVLCIRAGA